MTRAGVLERFAREERWTGVLAQTLGASWRVIEEGLPARTTVHDDPIEGRHKNGRICARASKVTCPSMSSLMLGTNDLKTRFGHARRHRDVGRRAACRDRRVRCRPSGASPTLVLMAPAPIVEVGFLGEIFAGGAAKSRQLAKRYEQVASDAGAHSMPARSSRWFLDGVHFAADQHRALGQRSPPFCSRSRNARERRTQPRGVCRNTARRARKAGHASGRITTLPFTCRLTIRAIASAASASDTRSVIAGRPAGREPFGQQAHVRDMLLRIAAHRIAPEHAQNVALLSSARFSASFGISPAAKPTTRNRPRHAVARNAASL